MASKEDEKFWDELVRKLTPKTGFRFEKDERGYMLETEKSIKSRIAEKWGFDYHRVIPLEASMGKTFEVGGMWFEVCTKVCFQVAGKGWATDFTDLVASPAYDEKKKEEEEE